MKREAHLQGILHISQKPDLSGSPVKEPSLKVPLIESLAERCPTTRAHLHSSIKVPGIRASLPPTHPRMERGPHGERRPYPETFLTYLSGSPVKEPPPRPPPRSLFRERRFNHRAHFIHLSKSPVDDPSSRFPKQGPYRKRCLPPEPFLHILQGPQQGSPPSRFPSQSSHRERHSTPRAPFNNISKSQVDEPTSGCPTEPPMMPIHRAFLS
jgi:hypothetical protein